MRGRRGFGCLGTLLALIVVIAVVFVVENGGDYLLFAPWAYGWFGQPTLTGTWVGTMTTHSGVRYVVYLQLERDRNYKGTPLNSRGGEADIDGHAAWCARGVPGTTTTTIFGSANRSASNMSLGTHMLLNPPPGPYPLYFRGAWHGTTLVLHVSYDIVRNHAYGSAPTPVPVTFHKRGYSAYQAACAHM